MLKFQIYVKFSHTKMTGYTPNQIQYLPMKSQVDNLSSPVHCKSSICEFDMDGIHLFMI